MAGNHAPKDEDRQRRGHFSRARRCEDRQVTKGTLPTAAGRKRKGAGDGDGLALRRLEAVFRGYRGCISEGETVEIKVASYIFRRRFRKDIPELLIPRLIATRRYTDVIVTEDAAVRKVMAEWSVFRRLSARRK